MRTSDEMKWTRSLGLDHSLHSLNLRVAQSVVARSRFVGRDCQLTTMSIPCRTSGDATCIGSNHEHQRLIMLTPSTTSKLDKREHHQSGQSDAFYLVA